MVNSTSSVGYQPFSSQPAVASGPEAPVRAEAVAPRGAPAADSQKADQKNLASRDESPPPPPKEAPADDKRVDVSV